MSIFDCCSKYNDYTVVEEREDRYICMCRVCRNIFTVWK